MLFQLLQDLIHLLRIQILVVPVADLHHRCGAAGAEAFGFHQREAACPASSPRP